MFVSEQQATASRIRAPAFKVMAGTTELTGVIDIDVTTTGHFSADTFRITASLGGLPVGMDANYWSSSDRDELRILFSDGTSFKEMIYGAVDDVEVSLADTTLHLTGRDLSGDIIDTKSAEHYPDKSSSQIVKIIAAKHGMTASVTDTVSWVGKMYEQMNVRLTQDQSEWDLLTFLAQQEGYDLWVSGKVLNFQPPVSATDDPYVLVWSDLGQGDRFGNFESIKLKRSQTLAKDVIVKVKSWNQAQGKKFTSEAHVTKAYKTQRSGGMAQIYSFNVPNLDKTQADEWAKQKAAEITKHERVIEARVPGDNILTNRSLIKLVGTLTTWDQVYFVDTITRRMSFDGGYVMEVRAKNHSTESTVII